MSVRELNYHLWRAICEGEECIPDEYIGRFNEMVMIDLFKELTFSEQDNVIAFALYQLEKKQKPKNTKVKGSAACDADKPTKGGLTRVK